MNPMTDSIGNNPTFLHVGDHRATDWRVRNTRTGEFVPAIWADTEVGAYAYAVFDQESGHYRRVLTQEPIEFVKRENLPKDTQGI